MNLAIREFSEYIDFVNKKYLYLVYKRVWIISIKILRSIKLWYLEFKKFREVWILNKYSIIK